MKKIVLWAVIAALITANAFTVFAEEKPAQSLTVDEAVANAVYNSAAILKDEDAANSTDDNIKSIQREIDENTDDTKTLDLNISLLKAKSRQILDYPSIQEQKDTMKISVAKFFVSVIKAEKELEYYDKSNELLKRKLGVSAVKKSIGYMSEIDYITQKNEYDQKVNERNAKQIAIENAHTALNNVMGSSLNARYKLVLSFEYAPAGNISVNGVYAEAVEKDPSIKGLIEELKVAEYEKKYYTQSKKTYDELVKNVEYAEKAISDAKATKEKRVKDLYNTILNQETQYSSNVLQLESLNDQLKIKKTQLELGKITQIAFDEFALKIDQQQETIRSLVYDHAMNVMQLKNAHTL